MTMESLLHEAPTTSIADIRNAVTAASPVGTRFVVVTAIDGPFSIESLFRDNERLTDVDPIRSTTTALVVDLTNVLDLAQAPFNLSWTVGAGHDINELVAYLTIGTRVRKLGTKKKLPRGRLWFGDRHVTPNLIGV